MHHRKLTACCLSGFPFSLSRCFSAHGLILDCYIYRKRKGVSARNNVYGKMALVLTLIIGAKYINFKATVLSNFQCGGVQLIWRAIGQGPTSIDELKVFPTMQSINKLTQDALAQKQNKI